MKQIQNDEGFLEVSLTNKFYNILIFKHLVSKQKTGFTCVCQVFFVTLQV